MCGTGGVILAPLCTTSYMLSTDSWKVIALAGLVFSGIAALTSGPWGAAGFTVLYGAAVLSILRLS